MVKEVDEGTTGDSERLTTLYEYDLNGNLKKTVKNDSSAIGYTYDILNMLTRIDYGTDTYTSFQYDNNGNRLSMKDVKDGSTITTSYAYDHADQLTQVVQEGSTINYTYDKTGNRLTMAEGGDNFAYSYNQFNQLLDIKKNSTAWSTFTYDLNGNQIMDISKKDVNGTIKDITTDYTYDRLDRLTNISVSDGTVTKTSQNYYNGDGQRIKKDTEGLVTKYYYDGDAILYTSDSNNVKEAENILGPAGEIIASKRFDGIYANMYFFYNYDIRGSVTNIIKPDGTLVKGYTYDEYGKTKDKGDSSFVNEVKFTGAVQEDIADIYLMGARYYNPDTGRFLTQDSYSGNPYDPWTQHLYSYCSGNPTSMVDPTGHRQMRVTDGEGGGAVLPLPPPKRVAKQTSSGSKKGSYWNDFKQGVIDSAVTDRVNAAKNAIENPAGSAVSTYVSSYIMTNPALAVIYSNYEAYKFAEEFYYGDGHYRAYLSGRAAEKIGEFLIAYAGGKLIGKITSSPKGAGNAAMARKWQGSGAYPGVDDWTTVTIKKGTKVWGGAPGQSNFYTTDEVMQLVGNDAAKLNQGLQIGKGAYPQFRPGMTQYEVTQDITVGYSKALANPQYGPGGFDQYFINGYENVLNPIKSLIMTNR